MIIVLMGYMASGKSSIGRLLAEKMNYKFQDLDDVIEEVEGLKISSIFESKGEIYFRKIESEQLIQTLKSSSNLVLSLGGGTPCYGTNLSTIIKHPETESFYLKASIPTLIDRLKNEKQKRPLIAHIESKEELTEFIGKHLFERNQCYDQANHTIKTDDLTKEEIVEKILLQLFQ